MFDIAYFIIGLVGLAIGGFLYLKSRSLKVDLTKHAEETNRRMYELAILKELGERIGYKLNVQNIIDIISGSLHQFIEYSAVSYMLLEPEKIIFKVDLEQSVSRSFIDDVRQRMLKSLSALLGKEFGKDQVEEVLTGAILVEDLKEPVRSFFNIPLVITEKVVGVLTVAHTKAGLYKEEEMTILYKIIQQASQAVTSLHEVLETEERKLNAMVESMTEGVVMTDNDYRVMVVNPTAKKIIGMSEKQELTIFDFIDNLEGKFDIRGKLEESVKLDKVLNLDEVVIRNKFYQIFVSPVKSCVGVSKNEILGGVVIFHDITHEKELQRLREDFTSMMVHELRSPLDGIQKMSQLLMSGQVKQGQKEYGEFTGMIQRSSREMLTLVNELLDVAKLEAGKFEIYPVAGDLRSIVDERIQFYQTVAADKSIKLGSVYGKNVPKQLLFDATRIRQVFNNLISNALKYTQKNGSVVVSIHMHYKQSDINEELARAGITTSRPLDTVIFSKIPDSVVAVVTDTGAGIRESAKQQLFNKFKQFQLSATRDHDIKGTGLGLVIAKGMVEAHGGIIGVVSEEGVGSSFYFTYRQNTMTPH